MNIRYTLARTQTVEYFERWERFVMDEGASIHMFPSEINPWRDSSIIFK